MTIGNENINNSTDNVDERKALKQQEIVAQIAQKVNPKNVNIEPTDVPRKEKSVKEPKKEKSSKNSERVQLSLDVETVKKLRLVYGSLHNAIYNLIDEHIESDDFKNRLNKILKDLK